MMAAMSSAHGPFGPGLRRGDGADAAGAKELREGDPQVDGKDEDLSHRANRTMTASACKTARRVRVASHCEFATHSLGVTLTVKSSR